MQCAVAREALSARFDGEREHVPSIRVDQHVAWCPDCAAFAQALQRFSAPSPDLATTTPDYTDRILDVATASAPPPPSRRSRSGVRWVLAAVAACLTGMLVVALFLVPWQWVIGPIVLCALTTAWLTWRAGAPDVRPARGTRR